MKEEIAKLFSLRKGHFRFESGHHGDQWIDLELLFLRPERVRPFAIELAKRLSKYKTEMICGPLIEGSFVALLVASELGVPFVYSQRVINLESSDTLYPVSYRIPAALRPKVRGKRLAIVNDVINAGSAVRGTFFDLQTCIAEPVAIGALLTLGSWASAFAKDNRLVLETIDEATHNLWAPAECPLCDSGVPLSNG